MKTSIRICIGTEPCTEIPRKVLQYTILNNTAPSTLIEFHLLTDGPELARLGGGTGFSLQRWYVPEFFTYRGRAIYLDADQLVFADIGELWEIDQQYPNGETCAWCTYRDGRPESSVMLIDCKKAQVQWPTMSEIASYILAEGEDEKPLRYRQVMNGGLLAVPPQKITVHWNHLNKHIRGKTRLLHYTLQRTQPWRNPQHPYTYVWKSELLNAIRAGHIPKDEIVAACRASENPRRWKDVVMHPYWLSCLEEV